MQSSNFLKRSFKKSAKYHINKDTLIGSVLKSTLYYQKNKENTSFERKSRSCRKHKFETSVKL